MLLQHGMMMKQRERFLVYEIIFDMSHNSDEMGYITLSTVVERSMVAFLRSDCYQYETRKSYDETALEVISQSRDYFGHATTQYI